MLLSNTSSSCLYGLRYDAGLVSYCLPVGEAYMKALQIAREINHKVKNVNAMRLSNMHVCFREA